MRVTILTVGSRGDVQPLLALGRGLKEAGHEVTIGTHEHFRPMIERGGLAISPLAANPRDLLQSEEGLAWMESNSNPVHAARRLLDLARPLVAGLVRDSVAACRDAEVVLFSGLGMAGYHVAEAMGVPCCLAALAPASRTRYAPELGAPQWRLGPGYNLLTHLIAEQFSWQPLRGLVNEQRRDVLGLAPLPVWGPFWKPRWRRMAVLHGFSPALVPRPPDWGADLPVTGYWFGDPDPSWSPPPGLERFIKEGPAPVYVGFGSMPDRHPDELGRIVLDALRRERIRAVLGGGWAGLTAGQLDDEVISVQDVPHDWLFPMMAAAVHHGGAGTTHTALRAGLPNVIVPFLTDQPFWGRRVAELGLGPSPIPRRELSVDRLAAAIRTALSNTNIQARSASVGAVIRSENGVVAAVDAFQRLFVT